MIAYLKGNLTYVVENIIIVEVAGIGYEIRVPLSVINNLPAIGDEIKIYTYMNVKEDGINLFGFMTRDDLTVFKMLITVSGIGPKGAICILSTMTTDELRFAIMADDAKTIAKSPGIGVKTAGKLILELKDKLKLESISISEKNETNKKSDNTIKSDAIEALVALGYSSSEAYKAIRGIEIDKNMSVEDILKKALKNIALQ